MFICLPLCSTARENRFGSSRREEERPKPAIRTESPVAPPTSSSPAPSGGATYSSYKTPEERAAFLRQQAEAKMAERMAALGIRTGAKAGAAETPQQRIEREKREKEERLRQAEDEDRRRDEERQKRLEEEGVVPPSLSSPISKAAGKKPPPPPSRKGRQDIAQHDIQQAEAEKKRAEQEIAGQALREQQEAQERERKALE